MSLDQGQWEDSLVTYCAGISAILDPLKQKRSATKGISWETIVQLVGVHIFPCEEQTRPLERKIPASLEWKRWGEVTCKLLSNP